MLLMQQVPINSSDKKLSSNKSSKIWTPPTLKMKIWLMSYLDDKSIYHKMDGWTP